MITGPAHVVIYSDIKAETDHACKVEFAGRLIWLPKKVLTKKTDGTMTAPRSLVWGAWKHPSAQVIQRKETR